MKSKKTIYLLLPVVLIIWGVIIYRLFDTPHPQEPPVPVAPVSSHQKPPEKDTLWLNYRDPFLGAAPPRTAVVEDKEQVEISAGTKNSEETAARLRYYGRITSRLKTYCLIDIDDESYTMKEGDIGGGFRLMRIYEDSVHLEKEGNLFSVSLAQ